MLAETSLESRPLRGLFCFLDRRSSTGLHGDLFVEVMQVNCCRWRSVVLAGCSVLSVEGYEAEDEELTQIGVAAVTGQDLM